MLVKKDDLKVVEFAPNVDPRRSLKGVFVQRDSEKYSITATDGKVMGTITRHTTDEETKEYPDRLDQAVPEEIDPFPEGSLGYIIAKESVEKVLKSNSRSADVLDDYISLEDMNVPQARVVVSGKKQETIHSLELIDGTYPNYELVFPDKQGREPVISVGFNLSMLEQFCKMARKLNQDTKNNMAVFHFYAPDAPVVCEFENLDGSEFKGLIMPRKITKRDDQE